MQASVDVTDDGGQTPLMVAAYHGVLVHVAADWSGIFALLAFFTRLACCSGYATFVQKLLERGASLRKHNWAGKSAAVSGRCLAHPLIHCRALSLAGDTAFQCACRGLDAAKQACTRGVRCHSFTRSLLCTWL